MLRLIKFNSEISTILAQNVSGEIVIDNLLVRL